MGIKTNVYTVFKDTDREFTGNLNDIAKRFKMSENTLRNKMKEYNVDLEGAIDMGKREWEQYTVFAGTDHEFTGTMSEIAAHFNMTAGNMSRTFRKGNMTLEEIIDMPLDRVALSYMWNEAHMTLKNICKMENKDFVTVYNKLKYGHTIEWAIESTTEPYKEE